MRIKLEDEFLYNLKWVRVFSYNNKYIAKVLFEDQWVVLNAYNYTSIEDCIKNVTTNLKELT